MPRSKYDVDAALEKKGFRKGKGDHKYLFYYSLQDDRKTRAKTKTSHGKSFDIGDNLLSQMAKQCYLTSPQFKELVDCTLNQAGYEQLLKAQGIIS